eukprot:TRINITY_DN14276_c0_g1_i3.p1 TRINITY_DN14276_c0_g1~~TRINITY_DN14276_c0_g1_i3.p1  ORF type:complete len:545 (+),score=137.80 TRINITY_DN14276_c0_g1_i3:1353-2987(+)
MVWGAVAKPEVANMTDIMSQQTEVQRFDDSTTRLQDALKEMGFGPTASSMAIDSIGPVDDESLRQEMAIAWILENPEAIEHQEMTEIAVAPEPEAKEESDDFMIALKLQQQEDEAYVTAMHAGQSAHEKVTVSYARHKLVAEEYDALSDDEGDYESDEEEDGWNLEDEEVDDVHVTKHDASNCGRQNAKVLEGCANLQCDTGNMVESGMQVNNKVFGELKQHAYSKERSRRMRNSKDEDRATVEGVIDRKTRVLLFSWVNTALLSQVNGCVSTGKEAHVFHAIAGAMLNGESEQFDVCEGESVALKVFKTTLNEFKNRTLYIDGDYRFRHMKLGKHNPRKIVKLWAQKERNNLMRMQAAGIPCPRPLRLKDHVLMMSFIGTPQGRPAPRLKEVDLSEARLKTAYTELLLMMKTLWGVAHLVHADLSEYNLLYHDHRLYMIDVAQAIERSHPHALQHLQKDCENVTRYFTSAGLQNCLEVPELIEFVTEAKEMFVGMQDVVNSMADPREGMGLHELIQDLGNQHVRESPTSTPTNTTSNTIELNA